MVKNEIARSLDLYLAFISDVHLGHSNTPTQVILNNLDTYAFPDNAETAKLDVIFINGDWFDRLISNASNEAILIRKWVAKFITRCEANGTKVRVLLGTRLHDWDQPVMFLEENDNHDIGCDLKYIRDIHIEYIQDLDIHVLYVPDEARATSAETWDVVTKLMSDMGITSVDYACMHGAFPYQLPPMAEQSVLHDPVKYESIVKHFISIGHVHQFNPCGKIIPQGSFDRICHGDEGTKGHVRVRGGEVVFMPNHGAMRYLTIEVKGLSVEEVITTVGEHLGMDDRHCRVRLACDKEDVATGMRARLGIIFPFAIFDDLLILSAKKRQKITPEIRKLTKLPTLTKDNLLTELEKDMRTELEGQPETIDACMSILGQYVNGIK